MRRIIREYWHWLPAALVLAVALPGLWTYAGPPMEEGFMLVFPELLMRGETPHVDFLHLYGPGSLWGLGAAFTLLGTSLETERIVGLCQHAAVISALIVLGRRWGRIAAATCGVVAALLTITPVGLAALAWTGALGFGLWGVVAMVSTTRGEPDHGRALLAGALLSIALLYRPDMAIAVGAVGVTGYLMTAKTNRRPILFGASAGVVGFIVHLGISGPLRALRGMLWQPVFDLRSGRTLPSPPSRDVLDGALAKLAAIDVFGWPLPTLEPSTQVWLWFWVLIAVSLACLGVAIWSYRLGRDRRSCALLLISLFSTGLLPQALQRPDATHLAWVSVVSLSVLPMALAEWKRRSARSTATRRGPAAPISAALVPVLILAIAFPSYSLLAYARIVSQGAGSSDTGFSVTRNGRQFRLGSKEIAADAQALTERLDALSTRGEGLVVAPADMALTPYGDAYLYHLFPDLEPATFYVEMDPGIANTSDSGLAAEVDETDWLVLSNIWSDWDEPNSSTVRGSESPNEVRESSFCLVDTFGESFELYRPCESDS